MWEPLVKEFEKKPDDPMLKKWVETMAQKYGNLQSWPKLGCDSWFTPWAKGMSMVVAVKCANGEWEAFAADRLPAELDDQIKRRITRPSTWG